jgi:hypothetical protein
VVKGEEKEHEEDRVYGERPCEAVDPVTKSILVFEIMCGQAPMRVTEIVQLFESGYSRDDPEDAEEGQGKETGNECGEEVDHDWAS